VPTITIRVSDTERADLESAARRSGQTLSEYIREALDFARDAPVRSILDDQQRRLERLEELAGL
jgi:hypothetical protein